MDGQTDVGHINLIGGLVTRNPPKNVLFPQYHLSGEQISDVGLTTKIMLGII